VKKNEQDVISIIETFWYLLNILVFDYCVHLFKQIQNAKLLGLVGLSTKFKTNKKNKFFTINV